MKKKLNFKSKIILIKKIENIFGKSENFFSKIIKNILFENRRELILIDFNRIELILIENFQILFEKTWLYSCIYIQDIQIKAKLLKFLHRNNILKNTEISKR